MVSRSYEDKASDRMTRGRELVERGCVKTTGILEYEVSSADGSRKYKVLFDQGWKCECPDFDQRKIECKHIHAVLIYREEVEPKVVTTSQELFEAVKNNLGEALGIIETRHANNYEFHLESVFKDEKNSERFLVIVKAWEKSS